MKYTGKRHTYDVKKNNIRLLRVILHSSIQNLYRYRCFPVLHWFPLILTLEHIRSRAFTSSTEQDSIVTIYDL